MAAMSGARRAILPLAIALVVLAAGLFVLLHQSGRKTLVAEFPKAISIYQGSDVRVLGVPVGKVDKVEPEGTDVVVTMHYDSNVQLPADAKAVIVAPSIVGDRYVQITPAYTGGAVLADGATLDTSRTAVPLELDDVYGDLDSLVVALGPSGANKEGALTDLLRSTAANLGGQGEKLHQTITDVSKLTKTLSDNKDQLFGSAAQLETFVHTLASHDGTVRKFTTALDQVSSELAGERSDVASALKNLSSALGDVTTFVQSNRSVLKTNISGLQKVLATVVKQRSALDETLTDAPVALSNLFLTYNPDTGTLDTNPNITETGDQLVSNPANFLCGLLGSGSDGGAACKLVKTLLPRGKVFGAGTGSSYGVKSDPTLGGLVKVGGAS